MMDGLVEPGLDLLLGHALEILGREEEVDGDVDAAGPLVEAVLGVGEVAAGDLGHEDGHLVVLEELARAEGAGLVRAADGAHAFGEDDDLAAALDDPVDLPRRVEVGHEVALGDHLEKAEDEGQVGAEELVVARHVVEAHGQEGDARVEVVQARGVVRDDEEGALLVLRRVDAVIEAHAQALQEEGSPDVREDDVDEGGRILDPAQRQLFLEGGSVGLHGTGV